VLTVYETARGIANGNAALVWTSVEPFALDGEAFQLGRVDGKHRLTFSGLGTLEEPDEPRSSVLIAGSSVSIAAAAAPAPEATPEGDGGEGDDDDAPADELTIDLDELNDSGMSGTATLIANGEQTEVTLALDGAEGGHPAHIHRGTCNQLDPNPAFPLETVDDEGQSETAIDVTLDELLSEPFAINVHLSPDEIGVYVACGNLS
jgi:hypothetical protein